MSVGFFCELGRGACIRAKIVSVVAAVDGDGGQMRGFGSHTLRAVVIEVGTYAGESIVEGY